MPPPFPGPMTDITNRSTHSLLLMSDIAPDAISTQGFRQPLIINWSCWHSVESSPTPTILPLSTQMHTCRSVVWLTLFLFCTLLLGVECNSFETEIHERRPRCIQVVPIPCRYWSMCLWGPNWLPFCLTAEQSWTSHSSSLDSFDVFFFFSQVVC